MDKEQEKKWKFVHQANFVLVGRDPWSWLYEASLLRKAADTALLQVKTDENADRVEKGWIDPVYKYLVGITIENLLKGIIIADHPALISEAEMDNNFAKHNVWTRHAGKLTRIKPLLTRDEKNLLRLLEHYVMWMGRYPIALTKKDYARNRLDHQKREPPLDEFKAIFETLYGKLSRELSFKVEDNVKKHGPSGAVFPI